MFYKRYLFTVLLCLITLVSYGQNAGLVVSFSEVPGFYNEAFGLELYCADRNSKIYYTTDGSPPHKGSKVYSKPITIRKTSIVRAIAFKGEISGEIYTNTFFLGNKTSFPTVSIACEPYLLFDPSYGLFKRGFSADTIFPYYGANFWSRKEIPIHTEIFESSGERVFSSPTGMRMFGGMSRLFPQKSLSIVAREDYGPKRIKYQVFPYLDVKKFKYVVLRNSGSDWSKSHLKDAYLTYLLRPLDFETQAFRPSHAFINGRYWGIYNIREKVNRFFLSSHSGIHKDSIEIIEHRFNVRRGTGRHYRDMLRYIDAHDLAVEEYYDKVNSMMEVHSYMDHQIAEIYIDNQDAGGNIKFWRPMTKDGRWRWVLYDTDWGLGLHDSRAFKNNTLELLTARNGSAWPNPPWSTFLLRNLLKNDGFKEEFINRFCDHMNTVFEPSHMKSVLDTMTVLYEGEIALHNKRWNLRDTRRNDHLKRMHEFIEKRPEYMKKFLRQKFDLGKDIAIRIGKSGGGYLILNDHYTISTSELSGSYFEGQTIGLKAFSYHGFLFSHWELPDGSTSSRPSVKVKLEGPLAEIKAVFKESVDPLEGKLFFNEIACYQDESRDWIELYNASDEKVVMENWILLDSKHQWEIPTTEIGPKKYLIICRDTAAFKSRHPEITNYIGNIPFGISKVKEHLQLYTDASAPIDSFSYFNPAMDSVFTMNLLLPNLDNANPNNWEILEGSGTPAAPNPYYLYSKARKVKSIVTKIFGGIGFLLLLISIVFLYKRRTRQIPRSNTQ